MPELSHISSVLTCSHVPLSALHKLPCEHPSRKPDLAERKDFGEGGSENCKVPTTAAGKSSPPAVAGNGPLSEDDLFFWGGLLIVAAH